MSASRRHTTTCASGRQKMIELPAALALSIAESLHGNARHWDGSTSERAQRQLETQRSAVECTGIRGANLQDRISVSVQPGAEGKTGHFVAEGERARSHDDSPHPASATLVQTAGRREPSAKPWLVIGLAQAKQLEGTSIAGLLEEPAPWRFGGRVIFEATLKHTHVIPMLGLRALGPVRPTKAAVSDDFE